MKLKLYQNLRPFTHSKLLENFNNIMQNVLICSQNFPVKLKVLMVEKETGLVSNTKRMLGSAREYTHRSSNANGVGDNSLSRLCPHTPLVGAQSHFASTFY